MATILVDTSLCNADYIVYLSNTESVGRYVTVRDVGSNPSFFATHSIIISTTSGYSFLDGGKEYIRRPRESLTFAAMSSKWRLMNTLAYTPAGRTVMSNVSTTHLYTSTFSNTVGPFRITTLLSTGKIDTQENITVKTDPIINQSNLTSTFQGLGTLGLISSYEAVDSNLLSTSLGLATTYISTQHLNSTFVGLGSLSYVSTSWLTSTFEGLGTSYISIPKLTSTVAGLGPIYISTASAISTVQGLGQTYVSIPQLVSTVSDLLNKTTSNHQSTFSQLGSIYISSASLVSTVTGLSNTYILASNFNSTFTGIGITDLSNSTSTIAGLATVGYISYTQLQSTVSNVFVINQSNVPQTLSSLGSLYLSAPSLQSTVAGLGRTYISTVQLVSTTDGIQAPTRASLISTVAGLGQLYVSTSGLVSTTVGLCNAAYTMMTSSINGMGSIYISSASLQSTTAGLGPPYIPTSQLTSTTNGVNYPMLSTTAGLGSVYLSSLSLFSSIAGLGSPPYRYISTTQLTSTTTGIKTSGYISVPTLTSTTTGLSNFSMTPMVSTVQGLGQTYLSTTISPDAFIVSTLAIPSTTFNIGVTICVSGNVLYFASISTIYSYTLSTSTFATLRAGFVFIKGITASATYVYVTDQNRLTQIKISDGATTVFANVNNTSGNDDGTAYNAVSFTSPHGLVVDSSDTNLYVADFANNRIRRVQISPLSVTTVATGIESPIGITIDSENKYLYVTNNIDDGIFKISILESSVSILSGSIRSYGICIDPSNRYLYTINDGSSSIFLQGLSPLQSVKVAGSGSSGNRDGIGSLASFSTPRGICFNPVDMCLYSIDRGSGLIRRTTTALYQSTINGLTLSTRSATQTQTATLTSPTVNSFITGSKPYSLPVTGPVLWLDGADPLNTGTAPANGTLTNWVNKAGGTTTPTGTLTYTNGVVTFNNSYITTNLSAATTNKSIFAVFKPSSINSGSGSNGAALVATQNGPALDVIINNGNVQIQTTGVDMVTTVQPPPASYGIGGASVIKIGNSGTIFVANFYGILKYTEGGNVTRIVETVGSAVDDMAVDLNEEYIYITTVNNIIKLTISLGTYYVIGNFSYSTGTALLQSTGTAIDRVIVRSAARTLSYINTTSANQTATTFLTIAGGVLTDISSIVSNILGNILLVGWYTFTSGYDSSISQYSTNGSLLRTVNIGVNSSYNLLGKMTLYNTATIYVTMTNGYYILAVNYPDFTFSTYTGIIGSSGYVDGLRTGGLVKLADTRGIAVNSIGDVFFADSFRIRKIGRDIAYTPITVNTSYVFSGIVEQGTVNGVNLYLNGVKKMAGSYPIDFPTSAVYTIGGFSGADSPSIYFNGTMSEVIIYNSALSDTDREAVETYLTNKWTNYVSGPTTVDLSLTTQLTSTKPITANIVTAATFKAMNGRLGGPNHGFYTGDATYVNSISDMRLKENIQTITFPLEKVKALQAVQYRMTSDPSRRWIGYVAQDVEPILPEIVRTDTNGWKSIQYTQLPGLAIEAVKELAAKYAYIQSLLSTLG